MQQETSIKQSYLSRGKWPILLPASSTVIVGLIFLFRATVFLTIGERWVVSQRIEKADAVVVLGGGSKARASEAARLYCAGYARTVIIMGTRSSDDWIRPFLVQNAVPDEAIIVAGKHVTSTYDEAIAVRDWIRATGARKLIIPTDAFHTRRVHWIFRRVLKGMGSEIRVEAVAPSEYPRANWWRSPRGVREFSTEVIKFAYYLLRY